MYVLERSKLGNALPKIGTKIQIIPKPTIQRKFVKIGPIKQRSAPITVGSRLSNEIRRASQYRYGLPMPTGAPAPALFTPKAATQMSGYPEFEGYGGLLKKAKKAVKKAVKTVTKAPVQLVKAVAKPVVTVAKLPFTATVAAAKGVQSVVKPLAKVVVKATPIIATGGLSVVAKKFADRSAAKKRAAAEQAEYNQPFVEQQQMQQEADRQAELNRQQAEWEAGQAQRQAEWQAAQDAKYQTQPYGPAVPIPDTPYMEQWGPDTGGSTGGGGGGSGVMPGPDPGQQPSDQPQVSQASLFAGNKPLFLAGGALVAYMLYTYSMKKSKRRG